MPRTTSKIGTPGFVADNSSMESNDGRQIDWDNVGEEFRTTPGLPAFTVKVNDADVNAGETAFGVDALEGAIPSGTVLEFTGGVFAKLSADADEGDVSLTVEALADDIADDATADFPGTIGEGPKVLPAGTVVGELLGSGKISPRVAVTNPATGILKTTAVEDDLSAAASGYGVYIGGAVYEALLPQASGSPREIAAGIKTELKAADCTFKFLKYADNTAS